MLEPFWSAPIETVLTDLAARPDGLTQMGLERPTVLAGEELRGLSDTALLQRVGEVDIFAEIEPNLKERILAALRKAGSVVGYLGDGIMTRARFTPQT